MRAAGSAGERATAVNPATLNKRAHSRLWSALMALPKGRRAEKPFKEGSSLEPFRGIKQESRRPYLTMRQTPLYCPLTGQKAKPPETVVLPLSGLPGGLRWQVRKYHLSAPTSTGPANPKFGTQCVIRADYKEAQPHRREVSVVSQISGWAGERAGADLTS